MNMTKKHAREENCWIEKRRDWKIRDTTIMWDRIGDKHIYDEYASNKQGCHTSSVIEMQAI